MAQSNTNSHEKRLKESTEKSWSLMKGQHKASKHVGNSGGWSKIVWIVIPRLIRILMKIKLN